MQKQSTVNLNITRSDHLGVCIQGSQIRQIWRILRQNCSDDSTEVTEGVTLTPEIFGNKQGATLTPEIFGNNTVLSLPFSQQIQFTLIVNVVNLN